MTGPARKMIYGAVALLLTVGLIYIGLNMYDRASRTADSVERNQAYTERVTQEYGITKYDGLEITGSTAITYIKQLIGVYEVPVDLNIVRATDGQVKTNTITDSTNYSKFRDSTSNYYINPMKMFTVSVERDKNDVIVKVIITQKP